MPLHTTSFERVLHEMSGGMPMLNTDENVADLLTKPLSGPKQAKFVRMILNYVFPEEDGDMGGD